VKILIILGHPAKKRQSLSEELANAYEQGAIESGHEVHLYKVADKQFDPILHEGFWEEQAPNQTLPRRRSESAGPIIWSLSTLYGNI
jgi:putative NADPH-quinone reductase